jgi:MerR family transcriptional regulator, light-induced transcriptional regulator
MGGLSQGREEPVYSEPDCEELWVDPARMAAVSDHAGTLYRTVETEIIPRLMLLHRLGADGVEARASNERVEIDSSHVAAFTELILQGHDGALAYLKDLVTRGARLETLCLDLLAPSARLLGEFWNADLCNFTDVTIALGRLQGLLRSLSTSMQPLRKSAGTTRAALFAPVPGEQHTFGLAMVCDFFRTSGWTVWGDAPAKAEALLKLVREQAFDIVGFAIGNDRSIESLATLIRAVRAESRTRAVRVLVGGPLLVDRPQIAALVGADATAPDARQAILAAERLVATRDQGR